MYKFYEKIMSIILNIFTLGYYYGVEVQTQHEMTKRYSNITKHVTFKEAKKWVDEHIYEICTKAEKIKVNNTYKGFALGVFEKDTVLDLSSEYFADIVRFDGVGYLFNSWGWFQMQRYMNKILKLIYIY